MARRTRPTSAQLAAWSAFLKVHQALLAELDRDLRERHGLPLAWYDVLVQLKAAGRELTMGEITDRLLISPSTCTRVVEKMVAGKLLERHVDATDARIRYIGLTQRGRGMLRRAAVTHLEGIGTRFGDFLGDDAGRLAAQLEAMLASLHGRPVENEG